MECLTGALVSVITNIWGVRQYTYLSISVCLSDFQINKSYKATFYKELDKIKEYDYSKFPILKFEGNSYLELSFPSKPQIVTIKMRFKKNTISYIFYNLIKTKLGLMLCSFELILLLLMPSHEF